MLSWNRLVNSWLGLPEMEATASGIPVIASRNCGQEMLETNCYGRLAEHSDSGVQLIDLTRDSDIRGYLRRRALEGVHVYSLQGKVSRQ